MFCFLLLFLFLFLFSFILFILLFIFIFYIYIYIFFFFFFFKRRKYGNDPGSYMFDHNTYISKNEIPNRQQDVEEEDHSKIVNIKIDDAVEEVSYIETNSNIDPKLLERRINLSISLSIERCCRGQFPTSNITEDNEEEVSILPNSKDDEEKDIPIPPPSIPKRLKT